MTTDMKSKAYKKLCPKCNQPPEQVGRGDGCRDPYCPVTVSSWDPDSAPFQPGHVVFYHGVLHEVIDCTHVGQGLRLAALKNAMTTDLSNKSVEEVLTDVIEFFKQDLSDGRAWDFVDDVRPLIARRLEEAQQKIVAQQARIEALSRDVRIPHEVLDDVLKNDDLSALAAHDAKVAAESTATTFEVAANIADNGFFVGIGNDPHTRRNLAATYRQKAAEYRAKATEAGRKE